MKAAWLVLTLGLFYANGEISLDPDIASANGATCVLLESRIVQCFGESTDHLIGRDNTAFASYFTTVSGVDNIVKLAAGYGHFCALQDTGVVFCWGKNNWGQTGQSSSSSHNPLAVPTSLRFKNIWAFSDVTCGTSYDALYCWGKRYGSTPYRLTSGGSFRNAVMVSGDNSFIAIVHTNNIIYTQGDNNDNYKLGRSTDPSVYGGFTLEGVVSLSCKSGACVAVDGSGDMYVWGNLGARLGSDKASKTLIDSGYEYVSALMSTNGFCGVTTYGRLRCLNSGGTMQNTNLPSDINIRTLPDQTMEDTPCFVAEAERATQSVFCLYYAASGYGQGVSPTVKSGNAAPSGNLYNFGDTLPGYEMPTALIAAGVQHTCVIANQGEVYCRGRNEQRECGQSSGDVIAAFAKVPNLTPARAIYTGKSGDSLGSLTCIINVYFEAWCWGLNWDDNGGPAGPNQGYTHVPWRLYDYKFIKLAITRGMGAGIERSPLRKGYAWGYTPRKNTQNLAGEPVYSHLSPEHKLFHRVGLESKMFWCGKKWCFGPRNWFLVRVQYIDLRKFGRSCGRCLRGTYLLRHSFIRWKGHLLGRKRVRRRWPFR